MQSKKNKKLKFNPVLLVLFSGIIIALYGIYNIYRGHESKSWPTTQGIIIESRIAGAKRIIGRKAFLKYEYYVHGERYESRRVSYTWMCVDYSASIDLLRELPKDTIVHVYYDPDNWENAVLKTELSWRMSWLFIVSGLAVLIGLKGLQWQRFKAGLPF